MEFGAKETEPLAQEYAVRNFNKSNVNSKTGELKRAVGNSRLLVTEKGWLNLSMDPGKNKKFYVRANAINYGAIRAPEGNKGSLKTIRGISGGTTTQFHRIVGDKKRSAVKKALQGELKKGSRLQKVAQGLTLDTGTVKISKSGSISGQTSAGKVTVTKAFDYFKLSNRQKAVITEEVIKEAWFFIENLIGRKVDRNG